MLKILIMLLISSNAWATTYYIRTDGSTATNCTGTTDAAYDGSGTGEACALNHPFWVFPPRGESTAKKAAAGDTIVIGSGSYRMGCQDNVDCREATINLTQSGYCATSYPNDCVMSDGSSSLVGIPANVTVVGCTTSGCTLPADRPELWAAGRIGEVLRINSDGVTIKDIIITDHDDCGRAHATMSCGSADANELSGDDGISIIGASNLTIDGVLIHGMRRYGLYGGNVDTLTVIDSDISYNAYGGWNGDSCDAPTCGQSGTLSFTNTTIKYNGCIEDNPGYGTIKDDGCYSQDQSGYGDGLGSNVTSGDWDFIDCNISHNTSDGIDLLYHNGTGTVTVKRTKAEGNAGNNIKVPQTSIIEDVINIANCMYFNSKSFTCDFATCGANFNNCRANGNAFSIDFKSGNSTSPRISSSTVLTNSDVAIMTSGTCTTGIDVFVSNNIFLGGTEYNDGSDLTSIYYDADGTCNADFVETYNICYNLKEGSSACPGTGSVDGTGIPDIFSGTITQSSPYYTGDDYADQVSLSATSIAINVSDESFSGADSLDLNSYDRGASWDAGALEYGSTPSGGGGGGSTGTTTTMSGSSVLSGAFRLGI